MRALVLHTPGDIRLENVPVPQVKPGHVLVKLAAVGVCGSDFPRMLIKGPHKMPLICGHEFSGHIVELGEGVTGWAKGQLVAVPPLIPCFECDQCQQGQFSRCRNYDYFGSRRDGAYAEYILIPVSNLLATPEGIDPIAVAMADPAATALHAIWKAKNFGVGQRGAVTGCGPIGLFAIQWMRLLGADEVVAVDVSEEKLEMARAAGATHTFLVGDPVDDSLLCDLIVDAAGHPSSINRAARMAAPGGSVVFIGIPVGEVTLTNATFQHFLRQEVSLHGSWNCYGAPFPGKQWSVALDKLASGALRWEFMVTHKIDIAELPALFETLKDRSVFFSKIICHA